MNAELLEDRVIRFPPRILKDVGLEIPFETLLIIAQKLAYSPMVTRITSN